MKEEKISFNIDDKTSVPEETSTTYQQASPSGSKDKISHAISGSELKLGPKETLDAFSQMNEKLKSANKKVKCKNKLMVSTVSNR